MPSRLLKQPHHIRHAEQIPNLLAGIHHFQSTSPSPRRNMQRHHRSQPRTIHHRHFLQVQNDAPLLPARLQQLHLQQRHIFASQSPVTFHHPSILNFAPANTKSPRQIRPVIPCHHNPPSPRNSPSIVPRVVPHFHPLCLALYAPNLRTALLTQCPAP